MPGLQHSTVFERGELGVLDVRGGHLQRAARGERLHRMRCGLFPDVYRADALRGVPGAGDDRGRRGGEHGRVRVSGGVFLAIKDPESDIPNHAIISMFSGSPGAETREKAAKRRQKELAAKKRNEA